VARRGTLTSDELEAQRAWVDLTAAHVAWANGSEGQGKELHAKAVASADALRRKWPEWPLPYRILSEAASETWASPVPSDYRQAELDAQRRVRNGAFARNLSALQAIVFVFVVSALGALAFAAGTSGIVAMREMRLTSRSPIASAQPGYVSVEGTLHLMPNADGVIGPQTKERGVWYELETNSGSKDARTWRERSAQLFVIRDESGEAVIDPRGMSVRTRHSTTKLGTSTIASSGKRVSERMLREGDTAYVLGELTTAPGPNGEPRRMLRVAEDGRRLLVSNYSQRQLIAVERAWLIVGATVFVLAVGTLVLSFQARYRVATIPGVLR
jgi:hypothetical protein